MKNKIVFLFGFLLFSSLALIRISQATNTYQPPDPQENTSIKASDIMNIRVDIDQKRLQCGLSQFHWTDPVVSSDSPVRATHLKEMRQAITDIANSAPQRCAPVFNEDPTIQENSTRIRNKHLTEIVNVLRNLTCCGDGVCNATVPGCNMSHVEGIDSSAPPGQLKVDCWKDCYCHYQTTTGTICGEGPCGQESVLKKSVDFTAATGGPHCPVLYTCERSDLCCQKVVSTRCGAAPCGPEEIRVQKVNTNNQQCAGIGGQEYTCVHSDACCQYNSVDLGCGPTVNGVTYAHNQRVSAQQPSIANCPLKNITTFSDPLCCQYVNGGGCGTRCNGVNYPSTTWVTCYSNSPYPDVCPNRVELMANSPNCHH
ncbi:MAG: hypothetical protein HQL23_06390 [Candidatus Omnitrophica bacterium]|nr:hypothetical protein [Candidatus Omnitrophota bacterium]